VYLVDSSYIEQENYIASNLIQLKSVNYNSLTPEGYCHYCGETISKHKLFCDELCAKKHEDYDRKLK
jgi:hypothetical protein